MRRRRVAHPRTASRGIAASRASLGRIALTLTSLSLAACSASFDLAPSQVELRCASLCDDCFYTHRQEECAAECESRYRDLPDLCARCLTDESVVIDEGFCTFEFAPITAPACASLCGSGDPPDAGR